MKFSDIHTQQTKSMRRRVLCCALVLLIVIIASFNFGRYGVNLIDAGKVLLSQIFPIEQTWPDNYEKVVIYIRLPRILAAVFIGAALSLSGATYQAVFKNPLVSPDILGAASGASLGAALAIFNGLGAFWTQAMAFAFSLGAVCLTYMVSGKIKRDPALALILSGIFIGSLAEAFITLLKFMADPENTLPSITYWLMGSLSNVMMSDLTYVLLMMVVFAIPLFLLSWQLNALSLGEDEARSLGVETKRLRIIAILCSTLLTATSISIGGLIGWVGLVIPHWSRMLVGSNNKVLLPTAALMGGAFLLIVDNVARSLASTEIPLGVLTAIVGAPFFIVLMIRGKSNY